MESPQQRNGLLGYMFVDLGAVELAEDPARLHFPCPAW